MKQKLFTIIVALLCTLNLNAAVSYKDGLLPGVFLAAPDKPIRFAQGNLQNQDSLWRLADNQYTVLNKNNPADGAIDRFPWSEPNYWGEHAIVNGGNEENMWRTLTKNEWDYLLMKRPDAASLVGLGRVDGRNGLFLLPHEWETPDDVPYFNNVYEKGFSITDEYYMSEWDFHYDDNEYTLEEWTLMEAAGAVFLPAVGNEGLYWSSSLSDNNDNNAHAFYFDIVNGEGSEYLNYILPYDSRPRTDTYSVRLVQDKHESPTGIESVTGNSVALKVLCNGQFLIKKNGKTYTVIGQEIR